VLGLDHRPSSFARDRELGMDEYGDEPDAALEAGDTAEVADDLGDGMSRTIDTDGSAQQSAR